MDITYLGQSSFKLKGKGATLVTDPFGDIVGFKLPKVEADIVTVSHGHTDHNSSELVGGDPFVVSGPGEYEVKGVKIAGVTSFHDDKKGQVRGKNTIYSVLIDSLRLCHLGDLGQKELTSDQLEEIGQVDILLVPTGGEYTIDSSEATAVAASLEPKIIIPMHYLDPKSSIKNLESVEKFLREMGKENAETVSKFSVAFDKLPEEPAIVVLQRSL